jgi:hypothetical protein
VHGLFFCLFFCVCFCVRVSFCVLYCYCAHLCLCAIVRSCAFVRFSAFLCTFFSRPVVVLLQSVNTPTLKVGKGKLSFTKAAVGKKWVKPNSRQLKLSNEPKPRRPSVRSFQNPHPPRLFCTLWHPFLPKPVVGLGGGGGFAGWWLK